MLSGEGKVIEGRALANTVLENEGLKNNAVKSGGRPKKSKERVIIERETRGGEERFVLPMDNNGNRVPSSQFPHTQIANHWSDTKKHWYKQARVWDYGAGNKLEVYKDIDFTDHLRPDKHPNPHQHRYLENETGGSKKRSKIAEPLNHEYDDISYKPRHAK